ncbi:hypothetical protein JCM10213v2_008383 [Rhodosporidiobolus nylandii]
MGHVDGIWTRHDYTHVDRAAETEQEQQASEERPPSLSLLEPSRTLPSARLLPSSLEPPVVMLHLSKTLFHRFNTKKGGQKQPLVRPNLAPFLEYLCGLERPSSPLAPAGKGMRRFRVVVESKLGEEKLKRLLQDLDLLPTSSPVPSSDPASPSDALADPFWAEESPPKVERPLLSAYISRGDDNERDEAKAQVRIAQEDLTRVWKRVEEQQTKEEGRPSGLSRLGSWMKHAKVEEKYGKRTVVVDCEGGSTGPPLPAGRVLQLPSFHPSSSGNALLTASYFLYLPRLEQDIPAALASGLVGKVKQEVRRVFEEAGELATKEKVQGELARRGRQVCGLAGVEVGSEWDGGWGEGMLERVRAQEKVGGVPMRAVWRGGVRTSVKFGKPEQLFLPPSPFRSPDSPASPLQPSPSAASEELWNFSTISPGTEAVQPARGHLLERLFSEPLSTLNDDDEGKDETFFDAETGSLLDEASQEEPGERAPLREGQDSRGEG